MLKNKVFILLLVVGVLSRLFLVIKLPIWHDEFYSVWASNYSFHQITLSLTDQVHPPGFYLLLHYWGLISQHIYWLRLLSVLAFVINIFLIKKLSHKIGNPENSNLLVFLYIFSGYFVIFDWQIRMYTAIVTLILFSILTLSDLVGGLIKNHLLGWLKFTLINFLGLYIDYAFVWYLVPATIFTLTYFAIKKDRGFYYSLYSFIWCGLSFVIFAPQSFLKAQYGVRGIAWMLKYTNPNFYLPFFLGTHTTMLFSLIFLILFVWGSYKLIKNIHNFTFLLIVFSASFSLVVTLVYTHFFQPIFHVRSMQIVGIMVLLMFYFGLVNIPKIYKQYIYPLMVFVVLFNFVLVNKTIIGSPGNVIVDYFPWRRILNATNLDGIDTVKYKIIKPLPTQMLLKGLAYTLDGNENIGRAPIKLQEYSVAEENVNCEKFYEKLLILYKCR